MEHPTQASQVELARLMFWLMVVGYNLRYHLVYENGVRALYQYAS